MISLSEPKFKTAASETKLKSSPTVASVVIATVPVPAGVKLMFAFEPFDTMSLVVTEVAVMCVATSVLLNVAAPASDISKVSAVTVAPPSLPLKTRSLSCADALITKSAVTLLSLPNSIPSSFKIKSALSTSTITSPPASRIISPVPEEATVNSALDPFETISFVTRLVAVTAPANVPAPSTSISVPFKICNLSLLNLAVIVVVPSFIVLISIAPSSVPSEASIIFPESLAYVTP